MKTINLRMAGKELALPDCRSCQLVNWKPACAKGLDMAKCASCGSYESRDGDLDRPPLVVVTIPMGREPAPAPPSIPVESVPTPDRIRGLGDVVARVTKAVGIRECVGCKKRREALNRAVPFPGGRTPEPPPAAPAQG